VASVGGRRGPAGVLVPVPVEPQVRVQVRVQLDDTKRHPRSCHIRINLRSSWMTIVDGKQSCRTCGRLREEMRGRVRGIIRQRW
jgi:hypothetical protein